MSPLITLFALTPHFLSNAKISYIKFLLYTQEKTVLFGSLKLDPQNYNKIFEIAIKKNGYFNHIKNKFFIDK